MCEVVGGDRRHNLFFSLFFSGVEDEERNYERGVDDHDEILRFFRVTGLYLGIIGIEGRDMKQL